MTVIRNVPRANRSASAAPTVNDDITLGYVVGSPWQDTTNNEDWICVDNADGAAVWYRTASATEGRIKTGTYTGDGTESQAITGIGFSPKYVKIFRRPTSEILMELYEKLDQSWGDFAAEHGVTATAEHKAFDNRINSLDADGFTVDDDASDQNPNADTFTYNYLALG